MTVNDSTPTRVRVLISGTVQGVGFRYSARQQADRLGLSGWVRNRSDGRVEAVFEGKLTAVEQAIAWCRQGPLSAEVTGLSVSPEDPQGLTLFEVRPTA